MVRSHPDSPRLLRRAPPYRSVATQAVHEGVVKFSRLFGFCLVALTLVPLAGVQAEPRYVTDRLEITMRSGTSTQNSIVRMLRSGTEVELVETDEETGYSRVRLPDGTEGWVLTRFLMTQPAARDRLADLRGSMNDSDRALQELRSEFEQLRRMKADVDAERDLLESANRDLTVELEQIREISASSIALDEANKTLNQRVEAAERELAAMQAENQRLHDRATREWFVVGAGVLFFGMLLGIVVPRLRLKKKSRLDW